MLFYFDKFELLDGLVRCSEELFFINILLLLHFFISWIMDCRKFGVKLDYWRFFCIIYIVIPIFIMYPISASYMNFISVGTEVKYIDLYVDQAYFISIIGYISMLLGRLLYRDKTIVLKQNFIENTVYKNLLNKNFYILLYILSTIFLCITIALLFMYKDLLFNGRAIRFINPSLGMLLNLILSYVMFSLMFFSLRFWKTKSKVSIMYILISILMAILMGSRLILMSPILLIFTMIVIFYKEKIKFWHIIIVSLILFILMIFLSLIRVENEEYGILNVIVEILYGNTFSDIRDFSWVLTGFEDNFLYGKTYLASLLSFIPSYLFEFRETYGIGVITNNFAGITFEHFGLRTGIFGEAFLNFGYIGVIFVGIIIGYFLQKTNKKFLYAIQDRKDIFLAYTYTVIFMCISTWLLSSANTFTLYVYLFIHILGSIIRKISIRVRHNEE